MRISDWSSDVCSSDLFTLNLDSHKLFDTNGGEIPLTGMEFDLLKAFADNPNRVLPRDQLLNLAHNRDWEPFDRSIDIPERNSDVSGQNVAVRVALGGCRIIKKKNKNQNRHI